MMAANSLDGKLSYFMSLHFKCIIIPYAFCIMVSQ